jgi:hypothetical protein
LHLELADSQEGVAGRAPEVDHLSAGVVDVSAPVAPFDGNAVPDVCVELPVVLEQRSREVDAGERVDSLLLGGRRHRGIQAREGLAEIAHEDDVAQARPAQQGVSLFVCMQVGGEQMCFRGIARRRVVIRGRLDL